MKRVYEILFLYPAPINLSYAWNFGVYALFSLGIQFVTGILLAMHYSSDSTLAFNSVEHIMRNVDNGWLLRYTHSNCASVFFVVVYAHIFRGIYYGSFLHPREFLWIVGVLLLLTMIITAFLGYVLPWGQMSFWAATVITNLFSAIPGIGEVIVIWLWSDYSVSGVTLTKFFSLHYFFPFIILGLTVVHILLLHENGSNNSIGINLNFESLSFFPYYSIKDFWGFIPYLLIISSLILIVPNKLGHPDNYLLANSMVTPSHIVPEWYFLPFYAVLRSIPDKLGGVIALGSAVLIMFFTPWTLKSEVRSMNFRPVSKMIFFFFFLVSIFLGWLGSMIASQPFVFLSQFLTLNYFFYLSIFGFSIIFFEKEVWVQFFSFF